LITSDDENANVRPVPCCVIVGPVHGPAIVNFSGPVAVPGFDSDAVPVTCVAGHEIGHVIGHVRPPVDDGRFVDAETEAASRLGSNARNLIGPFADPNW
jgi:hypothetical protein